MRKLIELLRKKKKKVFWFLLILIPVLSLSISVPLIILSINKKFDLKSNFQFNQINSESYNSEKELLLKNKKLKNYDKNDFFFIYGKVHLKDMLEGSNFIDLINFLKLKDLQNTLMHQIILPDINSIHIAQFDQYLNIALSLNLKIDMNQITSWLNKYYLQDDNTFFIPEIKNNFDISSNVSLSENIYTVLSKHNLNTILKKFDVKKSFENVFKAFKFNDSKTNDFYNSGGFILSAVLKIDNYETIFDLKRKDFVKWLSFWEKIYEEKINKINLKADVNNFELFKISFAVNIISKLVKNSNNKKNSKMNFLENFEKKLKEFIKNNKNVSLIIINENKKILNDTAVKSKIIQKLNSHVSNLTNVFLPDFEQTYFYTKIYYSVEKTFPKIKMLNWLYNNFKILIQDEKNFNPKAPKEIYYMIKMLEILDNNYLFKKIIFFKNLLLKYLSFSSNLESDYYIINSLSNLKKISNQNIQIDYSKRNFIINAGEKIEISESSVTEIIKLIELSKILDDISFKDKTIQKLESYFLNLVNKLPFVNLVMLVQIQNYIKHKWTFIKSKNDLLIEIKKFSLKPNLDFKEIYYYILGKFVLKND